MKTIPRFVPRLLMIGSLLALAILVAGPAPTATATLLLYPSNSHSSLAQPSVQNVAGLTQFVYTSDLHYGLARAAFRGATNVDAQKVNAELVAAINNLPGVVFPCSDAGVNACKPVGAIDFVAVTGDIANAMALRTTPVTFVQSAATSWAQFEKDYINGLTVKDKSGNKAPLYLTPGNNDITNSIVWYIPTNPPTDATAMVQIYNRMLQPATPKTKDTYNYATDKINYSRDHGGVHFQFLNLWPDSATRAWMANDLKSVSPTTPVVIFTHVMPDANPEIFTNPNGKNDINATDLFMNLVGDKFASSTKTTDAAGQRVPSVVEQRALVAFLKEHPNIVAYFHGHSNWNQFYTYRGPDNDIALNVFRVDGPIREAVTAKYENALSFQVVSIDASAQSMTVREYLWNAKLWGSSVTVSLAPKPVGKAVAADKLLGLPREMFRNAVTAKGQRK